VRWVVEGRGAHRLALVRYHANVEEGHHLQPMLGSQFLDKPVIFSPVDFAPVYAAVVIGEELHAHPLDACGFKIGGLVFEGGAVGGIGIFDGVRIIFIERVAHDHAEEVLVGGCEQGGSVGDRHTATFIEGSLSACGGKQQYEYDQKVDCFLMAWTP